MTSFDTYLDEVFILRFWWEQQGDNFGAWRGHVRMIGTGQRHFVNSMPTACALITARLTAKQSKMGSDSL